MLDAGIAVQAEPFEDAPGPFGAALRAALVHDAGCLAQVGLGLPVDAGGEDLGLGAAGDAERATLRGGEIGQRQRRRQPLAIGLEGLHMAAELVGRGQAGERAQGGAAVLGVGLGQHRLARFGQGVGGVALVHELEVRRQGGLQREAAQQRLAERVDRTDAHAAGQVEHLSEQGPGALAEVLRGLDRQAAQGEIQPGVIQRHPFAEGVLQPHRHFRRGGLGEGQALDALGFFAGEHQAEQAVGEEFGFARASGGRNKGRDGGVRGRQLLAVGAIARR